MGIPFDTYLVDEVTSVGDGAFRHKSVEVFDQRRETAGAIVVTHSPLMVKRLCTMAAVLEEGQLLFYDDLDAALDHHERNLAKPARGLERLSS